MSIFDAIISETDHEFDLGGKAKTVLSALLALMTDRSRGGFTGFLGEFDRAGLKDTVTSWVGAGSNMPVSNEQLESALGENVLRGIAERAGIDYQRTTATTAFLTPRVVDALTPAGEIPADEDVLSRIGGYLNGGAAIPQTIVAERLDVDEREDDSLLRWLLPLLLLGLLLILGYMFCGKSAPVAVTTGTNANPANRNAAVAVNGSDHNSAAAVNAPSPTERKLTEVSLPGGTKLPAYPGGIEDQLIKFIESDEYKNADADRLKDKWFNFDDLNFKFGTTELVPESKRQLDNIAAILKAFPAVKIKLGAYTDKKGDAAANKKLSDDRARAVKAALDRAGVAAQVPEAEGYGEEFAVVPETAADREREPDRRTSIRLLK